MPFLLQLLHDVMLDLVSLPLSLPVQLHHEINVVVDVVLLENVPIPVDVPKIKQTLTQRCSSLVNR